VPVIGQPAVAGIVGEWAEFVRAIDYDPAGPEFVVDLEPGALGLGRAIWYAVELVPAPG
jgi:hypothetical protein